MIRRLQIVLILAVVMSTLSSPVISLASTAESDVDIRSSYVLDVTNFLNVMTADPFYVQFHRKAFNEWHPRLSQQSKQAMQVISEALGDNSIGPTLSHVISSLPGFENMDIKAVFKDPQSLITEYYSIYPEQSEMFSVEQAVGLLQAIAMVIGDLEQNGFRDYWKKERLPIIEKEAKRLNEYLSTLPISLNEETMKVLWGNTKDPGANITLYLCSFASPHGISIAGKALITDTTFDHLSNVRIIIHEMFHPPFDFAEVGEGYYKLLNDPFFVKSFDEHDSSNFGSQLQRLFSKKTSLKPWSLTLAESPD